MTYMSLEASTFRRITLPNYCHPFCKCFTFAGNSVNLYRHTDTISQSNTTVSLLNMCNASLALTGLRWREIRRMWLNKISVALILTLFKSENCYIYISSSMTSDTACYSKANSTTTGYLTSFSCIHVLIVEHDMTKSFNGQEFINPLNLLKG